MNAKCLNCGAALVFDIATRKMKCKYCASLFRINEIKMDESASTMDCNIYHCTSCGAEVGSTEVESATYCAYCGQPTIVFNRVSKELKPHFIIPFYITKEQAVDIIREHFYKGLYVPKEAKNFEMERVHGIYIPYWMYDVHYSDRQLIHGGVKRGEDICSTYFIREADCKFTEMYFDASKNLNDESSQRLEPYDIKALQPFKMHYMCGFYADRYDVDNVEVHQLACARAKEMFDERMLTTCNAVDNRMLACEPHIKIEKETYIMLPAWFMTFRYKNKSYTMMVNGQTGKLVGAAPCCVKDVIISSIPMFIIIAALAIPIAIFASVVSLQMTKSSVYSAVGILAMLTAIGKMLASGFLKLKKFRNSSKLTTSEVMNVYAHNRQEGRE